MGFGKLDEVGAVHLAEIISTFPRRSMAAYTAMLLICVANMYDASTPYFTLGRRELAKRAGCSPSTADRFLRLMESDDVIVSLGKVKTKSGEYVKRTFWWLEGGSRNDTTPSRKSRETIPPVVSFERGNDTTSEAELQKGRIAARPLLGARLAPAEEPDGTPTDADGNVMMPWEVGGDG